MSGASVSAQGLMRDGEELLARMVSQAMAGEEVAASDALRVLTDDTLPLDAVLQAAFKVREKFHGRRVRVHILINAQNGNCSENCSYCAQASSSRSPIEKWRLKPDEELIEGARRAAESGAFRYCMVLSGRAPGPERVQHMARLVREIKARYPVEVCVSAGFLDDATATTLRQAGLDRYNHNLNTSQGQYGRICTTHDYSDRVATLEAARRAGLEVCSGLIVGMGEPPEDVVEVARTLRRLDARSIPVNFYMHVPGSALGEVPGLTPEYCLRSLCVVRFVNPTAEVRAAGGRELHLGADDARCLYPANSVFAEGYLNRPGDTADRTRRMIEGAGFEVEHVEVE